ncbi:hypothetical protein QWY16_06880 [Planococcus shenhongbingii]|uniref:hypothetical protein n=1 Tax=Planococcus shenhongbingii TaxID=3058398 RepID=UPI002631AC01|nr:hypothetical protein [Planococcus sp. N016]WKA59826.1 hypothetical protein QWY16_06880 [Planococcus sp. N016]
MPRKGFIILLILLSAGLSGCLASPEEKIANGMSKATAVFENEPAETNEKVDNTELYVPRSYTIEEPSDDQNIVITKGSDSFVLFINPNEASDSTLFYDLQKANPEQQWVADKTFEQNGRFGFTTVREIADDRFEVVVSAGGVKMTTISEGSKIDPNMEWMMKTVRSIDNSR